MYFDKFALLLAVVAMLTGCAKEAVKQPAGAQAPAMAVTVETLAESEQAATYQASGTVEARVTTAISARIMGYVKELRPQVGDAVSAGQVVAVIDSRELETGVQQANAALQEARGASVEVQQAVNAAAAQLQLATTTFHRMKNLFEQKSISNQEFDEASARMTLARTAHEGALARQSQVASKVEQARQAVKTAEIGRTYAEVHAPFAGIVKERKAEPGSMAAPGAPLLILEQTAGYRLELAVEESRLPSIKIGQPVTVRIDALDKTLALKVSEIVPAADAASRTVMVKVALPGMPRLRSGLYGNAEFAGATRKALTVPLAAVATQGAVETVLVDEAGVVRSRLVTLGVKTGGRAEVLSGLRAGERVLNPRPAGIADGARIEAK